MEISPRLSAIAVISLGILAAACGSSNTPTPSLPRATAAPLVSRDTVPEQSPTVPPIPAPTSTLVVPTVPPTPELTSAPFSGNCINRYAFVSDVTVPDGTMVSGGEAFVKTWRVTNTGTCAWGAGYTLAFVRGQTMAASSSIALPRTEPGATVDLSVSMTAPAASGTYQSFWTLKNPGGYALTPNLWVKVQVP
jgi:hypothetical protein